MINIIKLGVINKKKIILININITHLLLRLKEDTLNIIDIIMNINKYFRQ